MGPRFDTLAIENGLTDNTALLTYRNDESMGSDSGTFYRTSPNGIRVEVIIEINVDDQQRERVTVIAPDGYVAWPVEADVLDGDEVVIQIGPPMM